MSRFNFICIEGADKSGKTTLSKAIQETLPNINYWHFTTCEKPSFKSTDIPLQRDVPVMYQFNSFFNRYFFSSVAQQQLSNTSQTYLLDRTLYSDIVYGPIYRGPYDPLKVRELEKLYFTAVLSGLGAVLIFAEPSDVSHAWEQIEKENEGVLKTVNDYIDLRTAYHNLIDELKAYTGLQIIPYNFNEIPSDVFIEEKLKPAISKPNLLVDNLVDKNALGQAIGQTNINKQTLLISVEGDCNKPISFQEFANVIAEFGAIDYKTSSMIVDNMHNICLYRKNSAAEAAVMETLTKTTEKGK